jgi:WhiB family redox-sensing transcriptional regulator
MFKTADRLSESASNASEVSISYDGTPAQTVDIAPPKPTTTPTSALFLSLQQQMRIQMQWRKDALCSQTDPSAFFPKKGASTKDAKLVCANCKVVKQCLEFALETNKYNGIWGGTTESERRAIKRNRRLEIAKMRHSSIEAQLQKGSTTSLATRKTGTGV